MPHLIPIAEPAPDDRLAIVVSRWNESITQKLLDGALKTLRDRGIADDGVDIAWVPGAMEIPLETGIPVLFGILTCETMEQAIHRAGGNVGNKGSECAEAALHMIGLLKNLQ
jgi:6,7-dimethyl-8-ribityllumazine synthase